MIHPTRPGLPATDDDLGRPGPAAYERAGARPLNAGERAALQSKLHARARGPAPAEWVLPLAASAEERGNEALAADLRARAADPSVTWLPGETFQVPSGDQLWVRVLGLPGQAAVWVDDRRVGPVAAGADSGWTVVAGLADGEHVLLVTAEPGPSAAADAAQTRGGVVVRLASTEQDVVMVPTGDAGPTKGTRAFVARFLVV